MDYNARWYDSVIGRFVSPDSIIPAFGSPQAWDRFSYTYNNPLSYTDPSGNIPIEGAGFSFEEKPVYVYTDPLDDLLSIKSHGKPQSPIRDDPPPPPDPEEVFEFVFYDIPQWIKNLPFDAFGGRFSISAGQYIGVDFQFDGIVNLGTGELDLFFSVGGQGYTTGAAGAIGPLFVFDLVDNAGYEGWSGGFEGSIAKELVGLEASYNVAFGVHEGERPKTLFVGYAFGLESTAPFNVTYTRNINSILKFFNTGR